MDDLGKKVATAALEAATAAIAYKFDDDYLIELIVDVPDARHVRVSSAEVEPRYFQVEVCETRMVGQQYALFVRIAGKWRFEGIEELPDKIEKFKAQVDADIEMSKDLGIKTEAYRVVPLP